MESKVAYASRQSEYAGSPEHWRRFLQCWYEAEFARHRQFFAEHPDVPYMPILPQFQVETGGKSEEMRVLESIRRLEARLSVSLPRSYKDFLIAYGVVFGERPPVGMYPPNRVDRLGELDADFVKLAEEYAIESNDDDYFVYGTKQDSAAGRTSYLRDAIVVGNYGDAMFELIILYPQVRTADGEMEAALLEHAGAFRAPSFAEAMRQLSFLKTAAPDCMPPYSQHVLKGTCADMLPMNDVWWD